MQSRFKPNLAMFFSIAFLLIAWRIAPVWDEYWQHWGIAIIFALTGTLGIMRSVLIMREIRGPRPSSQTPPVWLAAWLIISLIAWGVGTPHLRIVYGPQRCLYAGWNGIERQGAYPCQLIAMLPLSKES